MKKVETIALKLHQIHINLFLVSLLIWSIVLVGGLLLEMEAQQADRYYKPVTTTLMITLFGFGMLHIWFGIIRNFSFDAIIKTVVSLFVSFALLNAILKDEAAILHITIAIVLYLLGLSGIYLFQKRKELKQKKQIKKQREENNDTSIRGHVSVFQTGVSPIN